MAGVAKLFDGHVLDKSNKEINLNDDQYKGKVVGLYFSAHWCPPCRNFTPKLVEFYNKHAQEKNFDIIFVSSDRDEAAFNDYYKDMPWLALSFKDRKNKEELSKKFNISGIPTLILIDGDSGDIICTDARNYIQHEDENGDNFPWKS
ncbi:unnamed protein product [Adineta steineri]|uniref:Nucleoredoxin n=1 Tax=Adineta steineri TaxID=433720 RepID=A0A813S3J1_9BILA|nr:unnamed protein product [Adineta steineri]CAF0792111.1 unnamed protein product [Adineta steineri]CAF0894273.1 unnamed protein product [Adineta steineri]